MYIFAVTLLYIFTSLFVRFNYHYHRYSVLIVKHLYYHTVIWKCAFLVLYIDFKQDTMELGLPTHCKLCKELKSYTLNLSKL